jgi:AraC-like DNA-binding protein
MVSFRYKFIVKEALNRTGIQFKSVRLGEVEIDKPISYQQMEQFKKALLESGLELIEDKKTILIEKIKHVIIRMIHYSDEIPKVNFSDYLSEKLHYDYTYLSNLFSENQSLTIEHFVIFHKIERVKEFLMYDQKNLSEIANILHYSSASHLSNQFKKNTGITPTFFKTHIANKGKRLI